jgi:hypothetical protein
MVIAFATVDGQGSSFASDSGGLPQFHLSMHASASDGTNSETNPALVVNLAAAATTADFNGAIVAAIETWVNGQHSWAIDPKNIYFQPFCNGS